MMKGVMRMPKKKSGTFDNKRYQNDYHKAMKTKNISFNPNNPEDMELWEHLQAQPNKTRYIKELIRREIDHQHRMEDLWCEEDEKMCKAFRLQVPLVHGWRNEEAIKVAEREEHDLLVKYCGPFEIRVDVDAMEALTVWDTRIPFDKP